VVEGPVAPAELARFAGLVLAVGPEGGFDDDELRTFGGAPRLRVGPFVLRAETAAIAAAAALAGDRAVSSHPRDRREW
jgi:16S rRNA (uracil1498-N3)-methyltransferase